MICDMKKYVILDIDRTIINGTSWYHACSCPNLLIDEYNIDRFKELNNKMYVHGTSKDRYEFRKQTFELINKRVSESAYSKLSECGCADEILIGQNVNEVFFEAVGIYTYKKLMKSDEDCKKIVDFIYKYYFGDIEFIFLTSGYEPFMKGLVKEYMKSFHKNCTWRTIGSTIKFSNGCIYLKEVMTQEKKFQFVKKIIDYGNRVVFLADDSVEEKELFSVVFRNGGYAFNVRYDEKLHESNWHELINDIEDENVFLSYLMKNSEVALSDCKKVQNNFFRLHMNEIGVICLNDIEYQIFLGSFNRDKKIVEYIKKVSHKKEEKYYLRGRYYYYWLPSYITGSLESKYAGWKKIVIDGIDIIEHIARYNIKENKYACILSYVICDHLLSVLYLAMYCAEEDVLDRERNVISSYRHIENSVCILNKILFSVFDNKIEYSNLDSLVKELKSISFEDMDIIRENEKFLLELDNYNTIYEAVYNIIDNLKGKAQKIDKVIYFAYGGISLGYAFKTIMKELFDKNVELLPSHYSSKRNNTGSGVIDRIPRFKCGENGWMDESTVLLLDNNVTTFKTLSTSKSYLQKRGNKVYCAVAEVYYKNIYKWLLGKGEYEEMCHNWFDVIDAKPIMNYFSAYNTWGTSETSALLEQLYSQDFIFQNTDNLIPRKIHSEHRKICRIHNVYDLRLAMEMGATMIGIHAVISCKDKYYKIEDYHGIKVEYYPNLPVPDYEIESIRYMVRCLPDGVMPILIIENKLSVEDIMKVINIYGLNVFKCGIQMQFRTNIEYINKIIEMGFERVIVAVGLMQKDVKEYLEFVDKALRTSKDLILLDMSRHQPHVIVNEKVIDKYDVSFETKYNCLNRIVSCLKKLETSVLLADDIMPDKMILCQLMLLSQGVNIIGLDMQNNIEVDKTEQKYCKIKENKTSKYHYAKIRKSVEKIKKWNIFE